MNPDTLNAIIDLSSVLLTTFGGGIGVALGMFLNRGKKDLLKVINAANEGMHKNEDLQEWAKKEGLKVAAKLIKS